MTPTTTTAINTEDIIEDLRDGASLHAMSKAYHLSREVIRQVGEKAGVPLAHSDDYRAPTHIQLTRDVSTTVCRALDSGTVFTMTGLRERFADVPPKFINAAIDDAELVPLLGFPDPPEKIEYTVDNMHAALRAAADLNPGLELTGPVYDRALKDGAITGPSRVLIIQRIGSWAAACEGAGVPYRGARRMYDGATPAMVWHWLDIYALDMVEANTPITFASYSNWARVHKGAPSGSLIKARMLVDTTWNTIRDDLILRTYQSQPHYWVRNDV